MRVGIVTLTSDSNYGNKLQNYALLKALQKFDGVEVSTLDTHNNIEYSGFQYHAKRLLRRILKPRPEYYQRKKYRRFVRFNQSYLCFSTRELSARTMDRFDDYDVLVCGSDQIWNPHYNRSLTINTGTFGGRAKRISYAASIGVDEIPASRRAEFLERIGAMDAISVREHKAAELLRELGIQKNIAVHADPSVLLTAEEWTAFEKKPAQKVPAKYLLTYFIVPAPPEWHRYIDDLARDQGLEVVHLNSRSAYKWYALDPNEFVYMVHHASAVCTDSFHATVFSILFHIPFLSLPRSSKEAQNRQSSRLETLLETFSLRNRWDAEIPSAQFCDIDFSHSQTVLDDVRAQARAYLAAHLQPRPESL